MKQFDPKNQKKKAFLRMPTFPGGKEAYQQFIRENIVYPEQALSNKVEGSVYLAYTVNNIGEVVDVEVAKGIGSGCDEEAIRVIRLMKYEPARNRGVKMKVELKTKINFKLPEELVSTIKNAEIQLNYSSTTHGKSTSPEVKPKAAYNYTINLGSE
jgi:TonB family protein